MSERLLSRYNEIEQIKNRYIDKVSHLSDEELNKNHGRRTMDNGTSDVSFIFFRERHNKSDPEKSQRK